MSEQHPNFRLIVRGFDVVPVVDELERRPYLWDLITVRQDYAGTSHADTESIILRGPDRIENLFDNLDTLDFAVVEELPETLQLLRVMIEQIKAREIGRVMLTRLKTNGRITRHVDEGAYARYFARFHLVITTNPRCAFYCGEEHVRMAAGEMWWFNHQVPHHVLNDGGPRVHLIMDAAAPGFTGALVDARVPSS